MLKVSTLLAAVSIVSLSACAGINRIDTNSERALVGAGAGCLAGEILREGSCVEGALAGGLAGALARDITGR